LPESVCYLVSCVQAYKYVYRKPCTAAVVSVCTVQGVLPSQNCLFVQVVEETLLCQNCLCVQVVQETLPCPNCLCVQGVQETLLC
jgi:hypothetical protein